MSEIVKVLVPRRNDNGWRDELWGFLQREYWATLPEFEIVEGHHTEGAFNRSGALNTASALAGDWEFAVIADSDSWVAPELLRAGVAEAVNTGRLVACFDRVCELDEGTTKLLLDKRIGLDGEMVFGFDKVRSEKLDPTTVQSTMLVIPRKLWDTVGGFDERFTGWGGEDNAFWKACELYGGKPIRLVGDAYHLWHKSARPDYYNPTFRGNLELVWGYLNAKTVGELP